MTSRPPLTVSEKDMLSQAIEDEVDSLIRPQVEYDAITYHQATDIMQKCWKMKVCASACETHCYLPM